MDKQDQPKDKNSFVEDNQQASAKNERIGEAPIQSYEEVNPSHSAKDDEAEIASTDDV